MKRIAAFICLSCFAASLTAAEVSGVFIEESVQAANGETLLLNGAGLREKLWIDVYVGSLYLQHKTDDVAQILSTPGPWRVQLDFVYREVARDKLLDAWREGFENNQSAETLQELRERIEQFYGFFDRSVLAKERYAFESIPGQGVIVSRNGETLGTIPGEDFKTALLEIWLGNRPADKQLKKGMLGL